MGGYSLNYHKHIHTGEGGILVTDDGAIAERLRLIRNHAEAVVGDMGVSDLSNMIGSNFRLGEIECAIGISQLDKLSQLVDRRVEIANLLTKGLNKLQGLRTPIVREYCKHAYYVYSIVIDTAAGYQNVHLLPMYQQKIAYGAKGFPWTSEVCKRDVSYAKGICPVAERMHEEQYIGFPMCLHDLSNGDVALIVTAFQKVWANLAELK